MTTSIWKWEKVYTKVDSSFSFFNRFKEIQVEVERNKELGIVVRIANQQEIVLKGVTASTDEHGKHGFCLKGYNIKDVEIAQKYHKAISLSTRYVYVDTPQLRQAYIDTLQEALTHNRKIINPPTTNLKETMANPITTKAFNTLSPTSIPPLPSNLQTFPLAAPSESTKNEDPTLSNSPVASSSTSMTHLPNTTTTINGSTSSIESTNINESTSSIESTTINESTSSSESTNKEENEALLTQRLHSLFKNDTTNTKDEKGVNGIEDRLAALQNKPKTSTEELKKRFQLLTGRSEITQPNNSSLNEVDSIIQQVQDEIALGIQDETILGSPALGSQEDILSESDLESSSSSDNEQNDGKRAK